MEVEAKFPYREGVEEEVKKIAELIIEKFEHDIYFSHPCRDFASSDEALRIRQDVEGITLTYKGPKVDVETKSREEVKLKVENFEAAKQILEKLGFRAVAEVRKLRRIYRHGEAIICVDNVEGLGKFLEIEVESESVEAKEEVFLIAERLGYGRVDSIRESYLELILQKKSQKDWRITGQKS